MHEGQNSPDRHKVRQIYKHSYNQSTKSFMLNDEAALWKETLSYVDWSSLKMLTLKNCGISQNNIGFLLANKWKMLITIRMSDNFMGDRTLAMLLAIKASKLKELQLNHNKLTNQSLLMLLLDAPKIFKQLERLHVQKNEFTYQGFHKIQQIQQIEIQQLLEIKYPQQPQHAPQLLPIPHVPHVPQVLGILGVGHEVPPLAQFPEIPNLLLQLKNINLSFCKLGLKGIKILRKYMGRCCTKLYLDQCSVGGEGFKILSKVFFSELEILQISIKIYKTQTETIQILKAQYFSQHYTSLNQTNFIFKDYVKNKVYFIKYCQKIIKKFISSVINIKQVGLRNFLENIYFMYFQVSDLFLHEFTNNFFNLRVLQKNMIYCSGIPSHISLQELKSNTYFGLYGRIEKIVLNPYPNRNFCSLYITYATQFQAALAVLACNQVEISRSMIWCLFGTVKYCKFFLKKIQCKNMQTCQYLHVLDRKNQIQIQNSPAQAYPEHESLAIQIIEKNPQKARQVRTENKAAGSLPRPLEAILYVQSLNEHIPQNQQKSPQRKISKDSSSFPELPVSSTSLSPQKNRQSTSLTSKPVSSVQNLAKQKQQTKQPISLLKQALHSQKQQQKQKQKQKQQQQEKQQEKLSEKYKKIEIHIQIDLQSKIRKMILKQIEKKNGSKVTNSKEQNTDIKRIIVSSLIQ